MIRVIFEDMPIVATAHSPVMPWLTSGRPGSNGVAFNVELFLDSTNLGKSGTIFKGIDTVFRQGDPPKAVFYIQSGSVKLFVDNESGREAVTSILGPGDFFGEGCLTTQFASIATAICLLPTTLLVIKKKEMIKLLQEEHAFSDHFIDCLLKRYTRVEQDLIDQLFNNCEKRLARTLLLLAQYGKEDQPDKMITCLSQETLAEIIGTSRPRVNFFMNKFRDLGFIQYSKRDICIHKSLLNVIIRD
jgi:CRP/FNR family cyclic AMP-dependent transcriptional regulator